MNRARVLGMLLALSACNGGGGDGDSDAGVPGAGTAGQIADFVRAVCDRMRDCCAQDGFNTAALDDCEMSVAGDVLESYLNGKIRIIEPASSECRAQQEAAREQCDAEDQRARRLRVGFSVP